MSDVINVSTKVTVEGKEYNVRQLNVNDLLNEAKQAVRKSYREEALEIASSLAGKEKLVYLQSIPKSLPKGSELLQLTAEWFNDLEGIKWAIEKATGEVVDVSYTNLEKFQEIIEICMPSAEISENEEAVDKPNDKVEEENFT